MPQAYIGQSRTWRHHLRAACTFLSNQYVPKLWTASSFGQRCLESLMIIRVISDTSENKSLLPSDKEDLIRTTIRKNIAKPLTRTADFGFTVGAPPVILECMARISEFRLGSQSSAATPDSVLEKAILKLDACRAGLSTRRLVQRAITDVYTQPLTSTVRTVSLRNAKIASWQDYQKRRRRPALFYTLLISTYTGRS